MTEPLSNRLHYYEAGWLSLLVRIGVTSDRGAHDAMCRVAQQAIDERANRRKKRCDEKDRGGNQGGAAGAYCPSNGAEAPAF